MPTEEALEKIRASITTAEERLSDLDKELKDADKAGIPQAEKRAKYEELKGQLRKIKSVYGG